MNLDLTSLRKSIDSLEKSINVYNKICSTGEDDTDLLATLRAGVIQNFEFTYEISWKMMKRWIEANYDASAMEGAFRRELYRRAAENGLITDIQVWMDFHSDRNKTSHIYDEEVSEDVFESSIKFLPCAKELLKALEVRN